MLKCDGQPVTLLNPAAVYQGEGETPGRPPRAATPASHLTHQLRGETSSSESSKKPEGTELLLSPVAVESISIPSHIDSTSTSVQACRHRAVPRPSKA